MSALGYPAKGDLPIYAPEGLPAGFSQEDLHELRTALSLDSFDLQHPADGKDSARKMEIGADVKVCDWTCYMSSLDDNLATRR